MKQKDKDNKKERLKKSEKFGLGLWYFGMFFSVTLFGYLVKRIDSNSVPELILMAISIALMYAMYIMSLKNAIGLGYKKASEYKKKENDDN